MQVKRKIELKFKTSKDAKIIYKTLEVDNENFLKEYYQKLDKAREMKETISTDILSMGKEPK